MEMTFGKHKGMSIFSLPDSYLRWLATSGSDEYIAEFAGNILKRWGQPKAADHIIFEEPVVLLGVSHIYIKSPFSLIGLVKSFPFRKWDTFRKQWYIMPADLAEAKLKIAEFDDPPAKAPEQQTLF